MYAVTCNGFGEPDVLTIDVVPTPQPKSSELLVRVKATALNRVDILQRRGKYPPPPGESAILGLEIAGEVIEMGKDVTGFRLGDRIFGLVGSGSYAEYCVIDARTALRIPETLSFVEAAAIPEAFFTASEALFTLGHLQSHDAVLIHAGASGVGTAAIQLAKQKGARVFTTVGHPAKATKVKSLGADTAISYKETDFAAVVAESQGVDVIIDFIGGAYLAQHLSLLKPAGRLICVGLLRGSKAEIDLSMVQKKRLQIKGLSMRTRSLEDKRHITHSFAKQWLPLFISGEIHPVIDSVFTLQEVRAAHAYMESNANIGKIILRLE